jgi:apolipoprotein D and lipocalin family protein
MNSSVIFGGLGRARGLVASTLLAAAALAPTAAQAATTAALESVPPIDLARYQGHWYQIALYPNSFQKQCVSNTTADYTILADGSVEVLNQCVTAKGTVSKALGAARVKAAKATLLNPKPLPASTSRLEVRFAPKWLAGLSAVWAPYWVIQLADDYRYAVVGDPTRKYLWILSRTPVLDAQDDAAIRARLPEQGFDPSKLRLEPQSWPEPEPLP